MTGTIIGLARVQAVNNKMTLNAIDKYVAEKSAGPHPGFAEASKIVGLDLDAFIGEMAQRRITILEKAVLSCMAVPSDDRAAFFRPLILGLMGHAPGDPQRRRTRISYDELERLLMPLIDEYYAKARNNIAIQARKTAYLEFTKLFQQDENPLVVISASDCGEFAGSYLFAHCTSKHARSIAHKLEYNDSPVLGARKRRVRLMSEYVILNVALMMAAINSAFGQSQTKQIIDAILGILGSKAFPEFEKIDADFKRRYTSRLAEYGPILRDQASVQAMAASFSNAIGIDPLKNSAGVMRIAEDFGEILDTLTTGLRRVKIASN